MNSYYNCRKLFYPALLLSVLFMSSCGEGKKSDAPTQATDTLSVKKLTTDSSSDMPVARPKDSAARIPNAYDSSKN